MKTTEIPAEFEKMRSLEDDEVRGAVLSLLDDPAFVKIVKGMIKGVPIWVHKLYTRRFKTVNSFQLGMICPFLNRILKKATTGFTNDFSALPGGREDFIYLSNHRDIVLDSAYLDYILIVLNGKKSVEIGIGNNLLIHPWIETLVRLNRSFVVNRSATAAELLESSKQLSRYIRFVIEEKKSPVWLAQREGRAKDSDDRTQKSVLKMLAMSGSDDMSLSEKLQSLHICPLTISYEYDPCDWLKAAEFQLKRDNPDYVKSEQADLDNMKTGIFGFKGHLHYQVSAPIDKEIAALDSAVPRNQFLDQVAKIIDRHIFEGYRIYPCNRIALDMLRGDNAEASNYTPEQKQAFQTYLDGQLAKIDIPNPDWDFLRERILTMYANPLINKKSLSEQ
ncbi:MAG: 1-acyl-sn-glycerol-3-phosphate acyltransferase [Bacteroidaceae bacterium]|nr:1-acyl-sn-glycerol-3-phosphate acyltransferase [Bacteroidaceae bacterium]